jgi:hypothetical protein
MQSGARSVTALAAPRRFDAAQTVSRTFDAIGRNFILFVGLSAIFSGVPAALTEFAYDDPADAASTNPFAGSTPFYWVSVAASLVVGCFLNAALAFGAVMHFEGRPAGAVACIAAGVRSFFPILAIFLLQMLGALIGLALLIAPGFFLMTIWTAAAPAAVMERTGVVGAFRRSRALTEGYGWNVFLFVLLGWALTILMEVVASAVAAAVIDSAWLSIPWAYAVTAFVSTTVEDLIWITGAASIYFELRRIKEHGDPDELAAQFD